MVCIPGSTHGRTLAEASCGLRALGIGIANLKEDGWLQLGLLPESAPSLAPSLSILAGSPVLPAGTLPSGFCDAPGGPARVALPDAFCPHSRILCNHRRPYGFQKPREGSTVCPGRSSVSCPAVGQTLPVSRV